MVLYHHGIKGMHWGIRRFQNKDGSLTAEGIKRYRTDLNFKYKYDKYKAKQEAKAAAKAKQKEIKRVDTLMNKNARKLTDAELQERINRLTMEKQVSELEATLIDNQNKSKNDNKGNGDNKGSGDNKGNGEKKNSNFAKDLVKATISATGSAIASKVANKIGDKVVDAIFKSKDDKTKSSTPTTNTDDDNNQNNQNNKKKKWTDKDVSGDYSGGVTGTINTGKNAVASILKKSPAVSVADLYMSGKHPFLSTKDEAMSIANSSWTNSDSTISVSGKKASTLYSSGSSVDVGKNATKNWMSGIWDSSSSGISSLGNFGDYSKSTTNTSIEKPVTSLGNFGEWSSSFTKKAASTPASTVSDSYSMTVGKNAFKDVWGTASSTPVSSISGIYSGDSSYSSKTSVWRKTTTKPHTVTGWFD